MLYHGSVALAIAFSSLDGVGVMLLAEIGAAMMNRPGRICSDSQPSDTEVYSPLAQP